MKSMNVNELIYVIVLLTRWIATAALRDGNAVEVVALNPDDLFADDNNIDATAVECDGAVYDSRYWKRKHK